MIVTSEYVFDNPKFIEITNFIKNTKHEHEEEKWVFWSLYNRCDMLYGIYWWDETLKKCYY